MNLNCKLKNKKLRFSKAIMNKHNNLIENISNKSEN